MEIEIISKKVKDLEKGGVKCGFDDAWLVKYGNNYFIVSHAIVPMIGEETLVFRSDSNGFVSNWVEVCGGRGILHQEAINDLKKVLRGAKAR